MYSRKVPVAESSMPQFLQAGLVPLWLRGFSHRHPRAEPTNVSIKYHFRIFGSTSEARFARISVWPVTTRTLGF